jgi:hypothetical protein
MGFEHQSNARHNPSITEPREAHEPLLCYRMRTHAFVYRQAELSQILEEYLIRPSKSIERVLDSHSSVPHVLRNTEAHYCVHSRSLD